MRPTIGDLIRYLDQFEPDTPVIATEADIGEDDQDFIVLAELPLDTLARHTEQES